MSLLRKFVSLSGLILTTCVIYGQQLPNSSHISETKITWNPAYTGHGKEMIIDGFFRMQWLGFEGAPVTGYTSLQLPLNMYNMSIGGQLHYDKTGPINKIGATLSYAYKLKTILGRYDQLSFGIAGSYYQYDFNNNDLLAKDNDDQLLVNNKLNSAFPSVGTGIYYISNTREYKGNLFFAGLSISQILTTKVLINSIDQLRKNHIHLNAGGRFYYFDSFIEPMITANIVDPAIVDILVGIKYEKEDSFWTGIGFSGNGIGAVQAGIILDQFENSNAKLKIGVLGNYGLSSTLEKTGPGFEFYINYAIPR